MPIALAVRRSLDLRAEEAHRRIYLYRIWGRVRFREDRGWSEVHPAVVDTGAPYSVIPFSLWPTLRIRKLLQTTLRGLIPGSEAEIPAILGRVTAQLLDAEHTSPTLRLWAMLVKTDQVPLILGWSGCLDKLKLTIDPRKRTASLEF